MAVLPSLSNPPVSRRRVEAWSWRLTVLLMVYVWSFRSVCAFSARRLAFSSSSLPKTSTIRCYARNRNQFYSIEDLENRRPIPPTLDSAMEDEGFGAYDYQPDIYDSEDMQLDESLPDPTMLNEIEKEQAEPPINGNITSENKETANTNGSTARSGNELPLSSAVYETVESPSVPTHFHAAQADSDMNDFLSKASYGVGTTTELDMLESRLEALTQEIYQQNNDKEFNVNSPQQVSQVLFGYTGESTNKEVLEGMAGAGNRMANLILQYRALKNDIRRLRRKVETREKGTRVSSVSAVARHDQREEPSDPLLLVDASAYIFRAYYSMPPIHRSDGMPTGAVMGFCNMLNRLILNRIIEGERPRLVLVFDAKGKTFRHKLFPDYKGNRPAAPMDLIPQFDLIRHAAEAYGICRLEAATYEADDVIATLATMAREEGLDTHILSGDKDLWQLVTEKDEEPCIHMIDPMTMSRVTYDQVVEKWGVGPSDLGDVLALAGDSADNIPGVPGIGPKIGASLIAEFGSLDNLLENLQDVKQKGRRQKLQANEDQARLSRELVGLVYSVPMEMMTFPDGIDKAGDLRMENIDGERILAFYDQMGFRDLKRRVESRLQRVKPPPKPRQTRRPKTEIPRPEDFSDVPF